MSMLVPASAAPRRNVLRAVIAESFCRTPVFIVLLHTQFSLHASPPTVSSALEKLSVSLPQVHTSPWIVQESSVKGDLFSFRASLVPSVALWPHQASAAQRLLAATEARAGLAQKYTNYSIACARLAQGQLGAGSPTKLRRTTPSSGPAQGTRLHTNASVLGQLRARRHLAKGVAGPARVSLVSSRGAWKWPPRPNLKRPL